MTDSESNMFEDSTSVIDYSTSDFKKNCCKYGVKELQPNAAFCSVCGKPQNNMSIQQPAVQIMQQPVAQPYVVNAYQQPQPVAAPNVSTNTTTVVVEGGHSNSIGTAGFIIALLGLVFCWIPFIDFVLWFLGLVFSIIGLFKAPRGMAIAGLVLSLVLIIVIIMIFGTIMELFDSILK